jgi:hypothetical protein
MGKNNRQRRAAKQRKRSMSTPSQGARGGSTGSAWSPFEQDEPSARDLATVFITAVHAHERGDADLVEELTGLLTTAPRPALARELQSLLELQVSHLCGGGWQPAVLDRVVGREVGSQASSVLRSVVAAEAASYESLGREVAPHWMAQLESIEARRWWSDGRPYLLQIDQPWADVVGCTITLMTVLGHVPEIPLLTPPPAQWRAGRNTAAPSSLPPGLLERVRALLAKAESTPFDAEADAFTAKAQQLMARHRIDRVVLESTTRNDEDAPTGRRLLIDDPYADAKAMLLQAICAANGGHSVWSKGMGFSEATEAAVADAEAETGRSLVPVLASRATAAEDAAVRSFPQLSAFAPSATDGEGWHAGTLFGDRADLGVGASVSERAAS